jgi:ribonuclease HI
MYTDGACLGNPGRGGYGVVLLYDGQRRELSEGYKLTTNNRMELMAAIAGLSSLKKPCDVTLYTDSQYLAQAVNNGWLKRWQLNGWKTAAKAAVKNPDLWNRLLALLEVHRVELRWVRGHAGNAENEVADRLSVAAANGPSLKPDPGFTAAQ